MKESGVDMSPLTKSSKPSGESKSLVIRISTGDLVSLDGRDVAISAIAANVQTWRVKNPESSVVLLTDPGASTSSLVKVADGVRQAGVFDIKISPMQ
ncbi:ExbD/TolR family protein [Pleionea mediterranea]